MKRIVRQARQLAVALAAIGIVLPLHDVAHAAQANQPSVDVQDVALNARGAFDGQIVDRNGIAQANTRVVLHAKGAEPTQVMTDQRGRFMFKGLKAGTYVVVTDDAAAVYRAWSPGTAPPSATDGALMVADGVTERGAHQMLTKYGAPVLLALATSGAVVAIVLADDDKPASP